MAPFGPCCDLALSTASSPQANKYPDLIQKKVQRIPGFLPILHECYSRDSLGPRTSGSRPRSRGCFLAPPLPHCLSSGSDPVSWVKIKAGDAETEPDDGHLSLSWPRRQGCHPPGHTEHGWAKTGLKEWGMQVIPGSPGGGDCEESQALRPVFVRSSS